MRTAVHLVLLDFAGGTPAIGPTIAAFGHAVEEAGVDNISLMDHYWQMESVGGPDLNMLEGYTTLGFLAGHTSSVELQLLVTGVSYRHPGLLAKIVSTLDVLSGGRAVLGLGAAWYAEEHAGLGVAMPSTRERFERLEETLQIVRQMWSDDDGAFAGKYYQLGHTLNTPQPIQSSPPIMVGGGGERKTLRLVAQYADACNLFADPTAGPAGVVAKLDVLRQHCADVGSDFDRIRKTITIMGPQTADLGSTLVEQLKPFADVGIDEVHLMPPNNAPVEYVETLGNVVVPGLKEL